MTTRRIAVVTAGLSNPSSTRLLADRLAEAVRAQLAEREIEVGVDVIELREHAHAITDNLLTGFARPELAEAIETVTSADALIAVTPIFTTSYSGLFKSFLDILDPDSLRGKPVLLAATGGSPRHSLALEYAMRPLFTYLHANPVSTSVFAAAEDWAGGEGASSLRSRTERAAGELADAVARRDPTIAEDPFDPATYLGEGRSFESLLGGLSAD
ncbi:MAG: NADPH-dependent FMN reductase [Microbacterium sp. 67-17]|uniref:FMN reductase n=1 Tax=Microbacterium sp. 67-17 TaxID=1895782 RepID=UPI0009614B1F|nr:FMN reductase [Microbacterium sp. 67-17]MBD3753126.1 FMN reductase [Micrococcales bacterium]OJV95647.1 MAG: NADPH-dependent FMN reductase [Microbacterium sp. 67-17]